MKKTFQNIFGMLVILFVISIAVSANEPTKFSIGSDVYAFPDNSNDSNTANDLIIVTVNRKPVHFDTLPIMKNDRVLVPMRAILEEIGAEITWDASTQTVFARKNNKSFTLQIGQNSIYVKTMYAPRSPQALENSEPKEITVDVPAMLYNDRTYVPIRAISETLNCKVNWDSDTNTVEILTNEKLSAPLAKYYSGTYSLSVKGDVASRPFVSSYFSNGKLYFSMLYAKSLFMFDGEKTWEYKLDGIIPNNIIVRGKNVYFTSGSINGTNSLYRINLDIGITEKLYSNIKTPTDNWATSSGEDYKLYYFNNYLYMKDLFLFDLISGESLDVSRWEEIRTLSKKTATSTVSAAATYNPVASYYNGSARGGRWGDFRSKDSDGNETTIASGYYHVISWSFSHVFLARYDYVDSIGFASGVEFILYDRETGEFKNLVSAVFPENQKSIYFEGSLASNKVGGGSSGGMTNSISNLEPIDCGACNGRGEIRCIYCDSNDIGIVTNPQIGIGGGIRYELCQVCDGYQWVDCKACVNGKINPR